MSVALFDSHAIRTQTQAPANPVNMRVYRNAGFPSEKSITIEAVSANALNPSPYPRLFIRQVFQETDIQRATLARNFAQHGLIRAFLIANRQAE